MASTENGRLLAGVFAANLIRSYLNDVHAASYPHTPAQTGGATYIFFNDRYTDIMAQTDKNIAADMALAAIHDFMRDESLSGEFARNSSISMRIAYEHFSARLPLIARLQSGETPQSIADSLQDPAP